MGQFWEDNLNPITMLPVRETGVNKVQRSTDFNFSQEVDRRLMRDEAARVDMIIYGS